MPLVCTLQLKNIIKMDKEIKHLRPDILRLTIPRFNVSVQTVDLASNFSFDVDLTCVKVDAGAVISIVVEACALGFESRFNCIFT